jgi:ankyrin repeat protein
MKKTIQYIIALGTIVLLSACSQAPQPPNITLFEAASKGNLNATKQHIAAGTNLDQQDPNPSGNKDTALGMAAAFGHSDVAIALINAGADLNKRNKDGNTPLHAASFLCHTKIVQALVTKGADKGARNNDGGTALEGVLIPWKDAKPIYEFLDSLLFKPFGAPLDYDRIQSTRPKIVKALQ